MYRSESQTNHRNRATRSTARKLWAHRRGTVGGGRRLHPAVRPSSDRCGLGGDGRDARRRRGQPGDRTAGGFGGEYAETRSRSSRPLVPTSAPANGSSRSAYRANRESPVDSSRSHPVRRVSARSPRPSMRLATACAANAPPPICRESWGSTSLPPRLVPRPPDGRIPRSPRTECRHRRAHLVAAASPASCLGAVPASYPQSSLNDLTSNSVPTAKQQMPCLRWHCWVRWGEASAFGKYRHFTGGRSAHGGRDSV